jgi:uncharacterized protein YhdP
MRKPSRVGFLVLIGVLLVGLSFLIYIPARRFAASLQETVIRSLEEAMQQNVTLTIRGSRLGLRHGLGIRLYEISLHERGQEGKEILAARYLFAALDLRALLRGDIRIQRIYVFQPRIHVVRDPAGTWNVAALFSAAYALKQAKDPLQEGSLYETFGPLLFRERIAFKDGEISFRDELREDGQRFVLRNLDLNVDNELAEDRVSIRIQGEMARPERLGTMNLEGEITGWKAARSVEELSARFRATIRDADLSGVKGFFRGLAETDRVEGALAADLSYRGSLLLPGAGEIELATERPCVSVARVHPTAFTPSRVVVRSSFQAEKDRIVFSDSKIEIGGLAIGGSGSLGFQEGRITRLDLELIGDDLPLVEARSYIPLGLLRGDVWRFVTSMVQGGRVDARARLQGAPGDFSRMNAPEGEGAFSLRLGFRDCTVVLPVDESYLPFHDLSGVLEVDRGTLYFQRFHGAYGQTAIPFIEGSIRDLFQPESRLSIQAKAELNIPEAFRELDHGIFPDAIRKIARSLREADGAGALTVGLDYAYGKTVEEKLRVKGEAVLKGVRATCDPPGVFLSRVNGRLAFTEASLSSLDVSLLADRSPVQINGRVRFGGKESGATGAIGFESEALETGDLARLLGDRDRFQGAVAAAGSVGWKEGRLSWEAYLRGERIQATFGSYLLPLEDLHMEVEGGENSLSLRALTLRLAGSEMSATGRWTSLKPLVGTIDVQTAAWDVNSLFRQKSENRPWEAGIDQEIVELLRSREAGKETETDVRFRLKCQELIVRNISLRDVIGEGLIAGRKCAVEFLHGNTGGGSLIVQGEVDLKEVRRPFSLVFGLSQIRTEEYCRWFSLSPDFIEGTASLEGTLTGSLSPAGPWQKDLNGAFSLYSDGCTIKRYDLLSKTLALINFTQWTQVRLSDLYARGVACRQIKGDFRVGSGVLFTDDLLLDTSIALVTFQGSYDILRDHTDAEVSLRPMGQLDQVLDFLPLVGRVISGPDGTFVVFHYQVQGPMKDLQVKLIPFKALNNRFGSPLKKLNGWLRSLDERLQGRDSP